MFTSWCTSSIGRLLTLLCALVCWTSTGCQLAHWGAIPATRLPAEWHGPSRAELVPVDLSLLRQQPPPEYAVGPGDILGIHIQNVLGGDTDTPPFTILPPVQGGLALSPAVGHPVAVQADGTVALPLTDPIAVSGQTLQQVAHTIRKAYVEDKKILQPGRDRITVNLIRPRTYRVIVVRSDSPIDIPVFINRNSQVLTKRGSAQVIELPAYENDVLHALVASGGLPGADAKNDVWVLRNGAQGAAHIDAMAQQFESITKAPIAPGDTRFTKIPLRTRCGEPLPIAANDVILGNGDVVFIESRDCEFFYVGGLMQGGQMPLPKDYDLDVLGAVAIANASVSGPAGANAVATNFRSGPGNIVPPSRVLIIRTLPNGQQIKIDVNIKRALNDRRERIIIQPGDLVLLKYTPGELAANVGLNFFNVNLNGTFLSPD